ncbi:CdaR family protein [Subsaxibacter sp. CAU 1640]|uniref:CdaR family protein n=1 Tax=Subsaxibacter sp. CAU 1640 TaxID=2933271 RepID=UPI002003E0E0|nr:CdaR family protein [Subsaxibacter sp. CAU 1640]MCK7590829.1 CdaR family protein [Subsaxibacter sp. CAU 1640]
MLLSFLFLVIVKLSKSYTEIVTFHVSYTNVPEQHSISTDFDSIVKVKVKAYGFSLLAQNFYRHNLIVDFNKEVKEQGLLYSYDTKKGRSKIENQLGSKIEVLSIQPDSLNFPYEVMTVKTVPVKLDTEISYESGYDLLDSLKLEPDSIKVIGPKKSVEKISRVMATKLKLNDVNKPISAIVNLTLDKELKNVKLSQSKVNVSGSVQKFTEGTFEVPVTFENMPSNIKINYFPKTVTVAYYVSLEDYKKIKALDFKVVCDYSNVKNTDKTFMIPQLVQKPKLVKSTRMKQNKIEFIIIE